MDELLIVKNLSVEYKNINRRENSVVKAVDDVSFRVYPKEIYALAGESGCGKSTIAKTLVKLIKPKSGEILVENKNIFKHNKYNRNNYPQSVQLVFQNPYSSLDPRQKIKDILLEPLDINTKLNKKEKMDKISEMLFDTGLSTTCLDKYPHEFSGGQRQRIAITRALILDPKLLIADEPVSALDASIQAQILNLLKDLKQKKDLTIIFISHDMNVIKYLADRIGIMYNGKIIEENYTNMIFKYPQNDYTKNLLNSVPHLSTV